MLYRELLATIKFGGIVKFIIGKIKFDKFSTCLVTTPTLAIQPRYFMCTNKKCGCGNCVKKFDSYLFGNFLKIANSPNFIGCQ